MAYVRCAICSTEKSVDKMYRCNNCEFWLCYEHIKKTGIMTTTYSCPKCHKPVKH